MNTKINSERNYGIDLLRILSMFCVVILHIIGKSYLLENSYGVTNGALWFVEAICYCAVNCYAIISGFVIYSENEKKYKYNKYISLWTGVFFWSFGITLVGFIIGNENVSIGNLIKSAFPVIENYYWYFSAYTALFFLIPWVNKFLRMLSKRETSFLVGIIFVLFSVIGLFNDSFKVNCGYSFAWVLYLYALGAWIKKCNIADKITNTEAVATSVVCIFLSWAVQMCSPVKKELFMQYTSPTMVIYAICLVALFSKIKLSLKNQKFLSKITPACFGVYIIHEHPLIKHEFEMHFGWIANLKTFSAIDCLLVTAICVFVICMFLEKVRIALFNQFKINVKLEKILKGIYKKVIEKLDKSNVVCYNEDECEL